MATGLVYRVWLLGLQQMCVIKELHEAWPFMLFQGITTGGWTKDRKYAHTQYGVCIERQKQLEIVM